MTAGWHRPSPRSQDRAERDDVCAACQVAWPCRYGSPVPPGVRGWSRVLCAPVATAGVVDSAAAVATTVARALV